MTLRNLTIRLLLAASTIAVFSSVGAPPALAAAPLHHAQVPGFYRTMVGDFEVTALFDGGVAVDSSILLADPALVKDLLAKSHIDDPKNVWGSASAFLVNTGSKLILIDTGTGGHWGGPGLGHLASNLKAAGYRPDQVDLVLVTHLHADHVGGIYDAQGQPAFPNARIRMNKADSDFWLSKDVAAKAPKEAQIFFQVARDSAAPYLAKGQWAPFEGLAELVPGIRPYPIPGHTPGHTGYLISSRGDSLLIWGDTAHFESVQMAHPEIGVGWDIDSPTAIKARQELFAKLAADGTLIAAAHMPFPSLGRLRTDGSGYAWAPVPFMNLN